MKSSDRAFDRISLILTLLLFGFAVAEYLWAPNMKPMFPWHEIPGFMGITGVVSCLVVVVLSKKLGSTWLQVPERHQRVGSESGDE